MDADRPIKKAHIAAHLAEKYPHLFVIPVPLKVGITRDLLADPDRLFSSKTLSHFLYNWCRQPRYCAAVDVAKSRYGLQGEMCDVVTNNARWDG